MDKVRRDLGSRIVGHLDTRHAGTKASRHLGMEQIKGPDHP